jgi:hypothetical protein
MLDPGVRQQAFLCEQMAMVEAVTWVFEENGLAAKNICRL